MGGTSLTAAWGVAEWSTVTTAFATAVLAAYAIVQTRRSNAQLREMKASRNAQVLLSVNDIMAGLRPKWHALYAIPDDFLQWSNAEMRLADEVGTQLQYVARLVEVGLLDQHYVIEGWGPVFRACWDKLEDYVKDYRQRSGQPRELAPGLIQQRRDFEALALRCPKHDEPWPSSS